MYFSRFREEKINLLDFIRKVEKNGLLGEKCATLRRKTGPLETFSDEKVEKHLFLFALLSKSVYICSCYPEYNLFTLRS